MLPLQLANKVGKASRYYLCIDIRGFASKDESKTIKYLMNDDMLSRIQYALSYESLFYFMPIDLALSALKETGYSFSKSYEYKMKIDWFGYWGHQYSYGEDVVLNGRKTGADKVSSVDTDNLYERMIKEIDNFYNQLDLTNAEYTFYFPPYSSLFWCDSQELGYFDEYLNAKEYFVKRADELGAIVYDFQDADFTKDLNNYKDTTHYSPEINDYMVKCLASGKHLVTQFNIDECRNRIIANADEFKENHTDLFE